MSLSIRPPSAKFKAIIIKSWDNQQCRIQRITGHRNCQTVLALYDNSIRGVTALEMSGWALRLGGYIHVLRKEYDLGIRTEYEEHEGGIHARYFLNTPIEIIEIESSQ